LLIKSRRSGLDEGCPTRTDRALRVFADVRPSESTTLLLLAANLFLLLAAYYLLKTIREPLILGVKGGGAEVKRYAGAFQAVLLVGLSFSFSRLAERVDRVRLIAIVSMFFASNLVAFYLLNLALPTHRLLLGVAFFVWLGCFDMLIVAQFWSFANDVYTREVGERLFPLIAAGAALGAFVGARAAKALLLWLGPYPLMLIATAILCASLPFASLADRRARSSRAKEGGRRDGDPVKRGGSFRLILGDRYLLLLAFLSLVKNWVNTGGEYILDKRLVAQAHNSVGDGPGAVAGFIGAFKADYYSYFNLIVLVLQLFFVSRWLRRLGVRRALWVAPGLALFGYSTMAIVPILGVIFWGKIAENSIDYSLQKTVEQTLYLVTSREAKYKAKAVIDTIVVRMGDIFSAAVVWAGARLKLPIRGFILINVMMALAWLAVAVLLSRVHRQRVAHCP
jgi:AAA family ATP:ADP antiporter